MNIADVVKPTLTKPRVDGDLDVVAAVQNVMHELQYSLELSWLQEPDIQELSTYNPDLQRFLINRNLRIKLGMASCDTSLERFALEASVGMDDYLENLRKYVIPALIVIASSLQ